MLIKKNVVETQGLSVVLVHTKLKHNNQYVQTQRANQCHCLDAPCSLVRVPPAQGPKRRMYGPIIHVNTPRQEKNKVHDN